MFRSLILAAVLLAFAPLAQTLAKSPCCRRLNYKLAIAITTATTGTVGAGVTGITGTIIMNGVKIVGGVMTTAIIAAGISAKLMSVAIVKAGTIAMTIAGVDMATGTAINVTNPHHAGSTAHKNHRVTQGLCLYPGPFCITLRQSPDDEQSNPLPPVFP